MKEWFCESGTSKKYGFKYFLTRKEKKCEICGFDKVIHVHHIAQLSKGGAHCEENVVILCPNHHKMAHMNKYKRYINNKLPKGQITISKTEVQKFNEERRKAMDTMFGLVKRNYDFLNKKLIVPINKKDFKKYTELKEKYKITWLDIISNFVGMSKNRIVEIWDVDEKVKI